MASYRHNRDIWKHTSLPINAFKIKRLTDGREKTRTKILLRRLGGYCNYDINHPKNSVVLPSSRHAACFLKKPKHAGQHDIGDFSYTNECLLTAHQTLKKKLDKHKKNSSCNEITNNTLIRLFNKSSFIVFKKIRNFKWRIGSDSFNFDPTSDPYQGCQGSINIIKQGVVTTPCFTSHILINTLTQKQIVNYDLKIGQ